MRTLTKRQQEVLGVIAEFYKQEQRPPTIRELAGRLACHIKTVYQHLLALEQKGWIERRKGRIRLPSEILRGQGVPIVGRVAAGLPILAVENIEGYVSLDDLFPNREGLFGLRVRGDSMVGAHICDGDLVVVDPSYRFDSPDEGGLSNREIVIVVIDEEASVKRLQVEGKSVRLISENPAYEPMEFDAGQSEIRIAGKVVGVIRALEKRSISG